MEIHRQQKGKVDAIFVPVGGGGLIAGIALYMKALSPETKIIGVEPTDSANEKALYIYRLLVHDKLIPPMPEEQVSQKSVRRRLAQWHARQLPKDHPLLK